MEGGVWREVCGGRCMEGGVWREVYGGRCMEGKCVWREVCGGRCMEGGVWREVCVEGGVLEMLEGFGDMVCGVRVCQ